MELEELRDQLVALIVDTAGGLRTHMQEMERRLVARMDQGLNASMPLSGGTAD